MNSHDRPRQRASVRAAALRHGPEIAATVAVFIAALLAGAWTAVLTAPHLSTPAAAVIAILVAIGTEAIASQIATDGLAILYRLLRRGAPHTDQAHDQADVGQEQDEMHQPAIEYGVAAPDAGDYDCDVLGGYDTAEEALSAAHHGDTVMVRDVTDPATPGPWMALAVRWPAGTTTVFDSGEEFLAWVDQQRGQR